MSRISEERVLRGDSVNHPRLQKPNEIKHILNLSGGLGKSTFSFMVFAPWNDLPDALKDCGVSKFPAYCKTYLQIMLAVLALFLSKVFFSRRHNKLNGCDNIV